MLMSVTKPFRKAYNTYVYWSPIPVLSQGEIYIFNVIMASLTIFLIYWSLVLLPPIIIQAVENLYYYVTGNSLSFQLLVSVIISKNVLNNYGYFNHKQMGEVNNSSIINNGLNIKKIRSTLVKLFI